jgi:hypothetical protein
VELVCKLWYVRKVLLNLIICSNIRMCILDKVYNFIPSEIEASGNGFVLNVIMVFLLRSSLSHV